jgi:hypothetical protein
MTNDLWTSQEKLKDEQCLSGLNVLNLEIDDRTEDKSKKNFEEPRAWEKVKKIEVPKARCENGLQEVKVGQTEKSWCREDHNIRI